MSNYNACFLSKMHNKTVDNANEAKMTSCDEAVKKNVMIALHIHRDNKFRFVIIKSLLVQHMSMGTNQYPSYFGNRTPN